MRLKEIRGGIGPAVLKLNAEALSLAVAPKPAAGSFPEIAAGKRLRQEAGPKLNKLEAAWLEMLKRKFPDGKIYAQAIRLRLANGAWFKVDFVVVNAGAWLAYECKGPDAGKNVDRGKLALKVAADSFPEYQWFMVWKEDGQWKQQKVLS